MIELTQEEYRALDGISPELHVLRGLLNDSANDEILGMIDNMQQRVSEALRRQREAESAEFDRKMAAWDVNSGNPPHEIQAIWGAYELGDPNDATPWPQARVVRYDRHDGKHEVTAPIQGGTLLDLFRAAEQAIQASGDAHHVFIEAFQEQDKELILCTGS